MVARALACTLAIALLASVASAGDVESAAVDPRAQLVEGNTQFALEFYRRVAQDGGNAVVSPLSVSVASAMLSAGARGSTEAEIARALDFGLPQPELHAAFRDLLSELQSRVARLVIAGGVWVDDECAIVPAFSDLLSSDYGATMEAVDFGEAPSEAARSINEWVTRETQGKIPTVVDPSMFSNLTRLTLVSTVYFLAAWEHSFPIGDTQEEPFHHLDGAATDAPMMHRSCWVPYYEDEAVQVIALPYQGSDLSLVVFLPRADSDLVAIEEQLSPDLLSKWIEGLSPRGVEVSVPRFESMCRVDLVPVLTDLGMKRAFLFGEADLTGVCLGRDLFVSGAKHAVTLGITERGTEAAAATVYVITEGVERQPEEFVEFRADRPFMYMVRDMLQGSILFMGRVTDPTAG